MRIIEIEIEKRFEDSFDCNTHNTPTKRSENESDFKQSTKA